jgi:membrane protease subunit HflC
VRIQRPLLITVSVLVVLGFALKMMTYTVNFTERGVLTTFGQVSAIVEDPGLKFKFPAPIQEVTLYDTRARVLQVEGRQLSTRDDRQLIVEGFMAWSVADPQVFFRRFNRGTGEPVEHYDQAEQSLRPRLRTALLAVSQYSMDELFSTSAEGSKIPELEATIMEELTAQSEGDDSLAAMGVEVKLVGITRLRLPADVTSDVIERMNKVRERIAQEARNEGEAQAAAITADAQNAAARILDFARLRAAEIRTRGDEAATEYLAEQAIDPDLAEFLARVQFLEEGLSDRITFILSARDWGMELFDAEYRDQAAERGAENARRAADGRGERRSDMGEAPGGALDGSGETDADADAGEGGAR